MPRSSGQSLASLGQAQRGREVIYRQLLIPRSLPSDPRGLFLPQVVEQVRF